jgi:hypothetical protein
MFDGDCAYGTDIQTSPCRLYPSREEISVDNPRIVGLSPVNPNTDEFGRAVVIDKIRNRNGLFTLAISASLMLQISLSPSDRSGPTWSSSTPNILAVMSAAALSRQRMLSTPHNCPASPTIEVNSWLVSSRLPGR